MTASPVPWERVLVTSTTTGTGALTVSSSAMAGYYPLSIVPDGTYVDYVIFDPDNEATETGTGVVGGGGTSLTRISGAVRASSNSGALVSLQSGTKLVFLSVPAALSMNNYAICQARLTLSSTLPVTTADQIAQSTLYLLPFRGNHVGLYNGYSQSISVIPDAGISLALSALTANTLYDVFLYNNAGTLALALVAWSNSTPGSCARATALATQDGYLVLSGTPTKRYLGTIYTTGTNTTEDSALNRLVWNYYNRVRRPMAVFDATANWTYGTASWRQARGSSANQLSAVVGVAEVSFSGQVTVLMSSTTSNPSGLTVGIGTDSTTAPDPMCQMMEAVSNVSGYFQSALASLDMQPSAGYHYWAWLEDAVSGNNVTIYGNFGSPVQRRAGVVGMIEG